MSEDPQPEETPPQPQSSSRKAFDDLKDAAKRAWEETMREAKQSADGAVPKLKEEFKRAANELVYDLSYATQFTSTLAKNAIPDVTVNAGEEGATAGKEAAEEFLRKRQEAKEASTAPPQEPIDPPEAAPAS
ncbi:MAG: hypothetical protein AAGH89_08360 [Verrucomicrobiota bacterium]